MASFPPSFAFVPAPAHGMRHICNPSFESPARATCRGAVGRPARSAGLWGAASRTGGCPRMAAERLNIAVVGSGPVGCLAAAALARLNQNYAVTIFDRVGDPSAKQEEAPQRTSNFPNINMTLYLRGMRVLESLGVQVSDNPNVFVPVTRRLLHQKRSEPIEARGIEANLFSFVSADLNRLCLDSAKNSGVALRYGCALERLDADDNTAIFVESGSDGEPLGTISVKYDMLIGCDGMSSKVRSELVRHGVVEVTELNEEADFKMARMPPLPMFQHYEESWLHSHHNWTPWFGPNIVCPTHLLKEETGGAMERWTAVIALGQRAPGDKFGTPSAVKAYFEKYFPDVVYAFNRLDAFIMSQDDAAAGSSGLQAKDRLSSFQTCCQELASFPKLSTKRAKRCSRLSAGRIGLVGDAAHVMSPSIGQGLNSGLEDVAALVNAMTIAQGSVDRALSIYDECRRPDADAVIRLSYRGARGRVWPRLENEMAYALRKIFHVLLPGLVKDTPLLGDLASGEAHYRSIYDEQMFFVWIVRVLGFSGSLLAVGAWSAALALGG